MWPFLSLDGEHQPVTPDLVGRSSGVALRQWTASESARYAATVRAEPRDGVPATFAGMLCQFDVDFPAIGPWDVRRVLHAEQSIEVFDAVPPTGAWSVRTAVTDVRDTGAGCVVGISAEAVDTRHGALAARTRMGLYVRGEHTGVGQPAAPLIAPGGWPSREVRVRVPRDQARRFAAAGDDNPLHLDPEVALASGFEQPIMQGLCTLGMSVAALGPATRVDARFTAPVRPGTQLTVRLWDRDPQRFDVLDEDGRVVVDHGGIALQS